jgi:methylthioribose-1-phosphate isomerase
MPVETIRWHDGRIRIIDQTKLPTEKVFLEIDNIQTLGEAIRSLRVRGAPAIGIAGAMGAALAAECFEGSDSKALVSTVREAVAFLRTTRPTAVNLFWALDRMEKVLKTVEAGSVSEIRMRLLKEAQTILDEDLDACRRLGYHGAKLLPGEVNILTHCNAGGLATSGYGTALGVIYAAVEMGKRVHVYADETRPLLQGSRLTAWELQFEGLDVTVLCDSAAASLMARGKIDCIVVGADRIAANGDTANKIGTYGLAVQAHHHQIPFYIAAPVSTLDFNIPIGDEIPIEERSSDEVRCGFGTLTAPVDIAVYNPAFDVTPHEFITAIITEEGVMRPPFDHAIGRLRYALSRNIE